MTKLQKAMADMDAQPWQLWECDKGRRWSSKYDRSDQEGDVCSFSGCLPDHVIHLRGETFSPPYEWFQGWEPWESSPKYQSLVA